MLTGRQSGPAEPRDGILDQAESPSEVKMRYTIITLFVLVAALFAGSGDTQSLPPELEQLKKAFEKYQDPYVAVRDGYFSTVGCVDYPKAGGHGRVPYPVGAMGVHFLNPALIGPTVDVMKPQ